ncbi:MAG: hypothetical protein KME59_18470 [Trichormus sp. ATA11-4-KO1]|jgi:transposase-like protein|nr:hypothetical protein [Trichormus sp. ATA11-4-KO1]
MLYLASTAVGKSVVFFNASRLSLAAPRVTQVNFCASVKSVTSYCHCRIVKNGRTHYGKQRFKCQNCGRQFVESATRQPIENSTRELIDKLLLERLSLAAIARVTGVSSRWVSKILLHSTF